MGYVGKQHALERAGMSPMRQSKISLTLAIRANRCKTGISTTSKGIDALNRSVYNSSDRQGLLLLKLSRHNLDTDRCPMIDGWVI